MIMSQVLLVDTALSRYRCSSHNASRLASFQKSVDRYLINQKQNVTLNAKDVKNRVYSSYSLKSNVVVVVVNDG